jgi:peptidoglycan/LPS O-acetylase OafA/YrhL
MNESASSIPASGRIAALDGLRAIAILLVIPHNIVMITGHLSAIEYPVMVYLHAGWIGVQLFFVLSGFLITGQLLDARGTPGYFGNFFERRARRILPLYFGTLLLTMVVLPSLIHVPEALRASLGEQVWLWTFLNNWTEPYTGGVVGFGHFWSLAVEEQFYLLWPFVVLHCAPARMLRVCLAITGLAIMIRIAMELAHFPHQALYMFTVCRMDALALGAAVAAAIRLPDLAARLRAHGGAVAVAALLVLGLVAATTRVFSIYDSVSQIIGYTLLAVGFALAVLACLLPMTGWMARVRAVLETRPMGLLARYSYGMYIFHLPLHRFLGEMLLRRYVPVITHTATFIYSGMVVVASFVLAAASHEFFEKRFLNRRRGPIALPA